MTLNDLEPFQKGFLVNFFAQFCTTTRISRVNCAKIRLEIDQDNLRMKFSAWNVDFSSLKSGRSRFKQACARGCQREVPLYKVVIYTVCLSSV